MKVKSISCVRLFTTAWSAAYQAPLSMGFSRQEYWSGVPLPFPIDNLLLFLHILFLMFFSIMVYHRILKIVYCATHQGLVADPL